MLEVSDAVAPSLAAVLENARMAQRDWTRTAILYRLRIIRRVRDLIAGQAEALLDRFPATLVRTRADSLTSEIIPLAEACRFLELKADSLLSPEQLSGKARPFWLRRVDIEVRREPFGVVLIIGPSNYPLFLAGVQALQALVAGNAVLMKPGRGATPLMTLFAEMLNAAGVPPGLFTILDERVEAVTAAIREGVDKVFLTGSAASGRAVLHETAEAITPAVVELSGEDALFVRADADVGKAVAALRFGMEMNGGETCIAPRRVFVHEAVADEFGRQFVQSGRSIPVVTVSSDAEAVELASGSPYALGATIFGGEGQARAMAADVRAGVVVINDMIVPTADPRVPFGGRGLSGFGVTRGAEGLLEMTTLKAVVVQRARRLPHLRSTPRNAESLFLAYLSAKHRSGRIDRWIGWQRLVKAISGARKAVDEGQ